MTEYRTETEKLLFSLPLAGSAFRKVYYDPNLGRPSGIFVPSEDVVVNYGASDFKVEGDFYEIFSEKNDLHTLQIELEKKYDLSFCGIIYSPKNIIKINKEGFAPISYELNVNPSKSVNLDFFMNPVYDIKFKTDETGLIFELNDDHRWTEDAIKMKLEAGDHKLRVYRLGDIIDEQTIVADQPLTFQYYLKRGVIIHP